MILIWGQRLYGKCERVPGEFYVATKFFHLWYIPLIPLGSWVVIEGSDVEDGWSGTPLSMVGKSVFFAYLRAALVVGAIFGVIGAVTAPPGVMAFAPPLFGAVVAAGIFVASKIFDKANAENTLVYARHLGLAEDDAVAFAESVHAREAPHAGGRTTPTGG